MKKRLLLLATSSILFIAAVLLAYLTCQFFTYFIAGFFSIPVAFEYYSLVFPIKDNSPLWTEYAITAIYGVPLFIALLFSLISKSLFLSYRRKSGNQKLFFIWLKLAFENLFFGSIIVSVLTKTNVSFFLNWMYIPYSVQIVMVMFSGVLFFRCSKNLATSFLHTAPNHQFLNEDHQFIYKFFVSYIPYFLGSIVFLILWFPALQLEKQIYLLPMAIPLLGTIAQTNSDNVKLVKNSRVFNPNWLLLIPIFGYFITFIVS